MPYNPEQHTTTNKSYGIAQACPTDARSWFSDGIIYRPFADTAEVLGYLNEDRYRSGHFSIFIKPAGQPTKEYWFKDGVEDTDLIEKVGGGGPVTDTNFANTDLVATGNRLHDFAGNNLTFQSLNDFEAYATAVLLSADSSFSLHCYDTITFSGHNISNTLQVSITADSFSVKRGTDPVKEVVTSVNDITAGPDGNIDLSTFKPTLTSAQIGFGDISSKLSGSPNFLFASNKLIIAQSGTTPFPAAKMFWENSSTFRINAGNDDDSVSPAKNLTLACGGGVTINCYQTTINASDSVSVAPVLKINNGISISNVQLNLSFPTVAKSIAFIRQNVAGAAGSGGSNFTIDGAGASQNSSTNNLNGGDIAISSGISTGTGTSKLEFKTPIPGASGNADNTPATRLTIGGTNKSFLTVAAGSTSYAPLKFTSSAGGLLSTPLDGAVEYDGTHLYFTAGSTRKQIDDQTGSTAENAQTGTTYTLALSDAGKLISMNNSGANTITIPPNSSVAFGLNIKIEIVQKGTGQTTIAPGAGVTLQAADGALKLRTQISGATIYKTGTDTWYVFGDLVV